MRMNTQEADTREESEMCRAEEKALMESWHVAQICNPSTGESRTGGMLWGHDQPVLYS